MACDLEEKLSLDLNLILVEGKTCVKFLSTFTFLALMARFQVFDESIIVERDDFADFSAIILQATFSYAHTK